MFWELNNLVEIYGKDTWSRHFSDLLHRALKLRYTMKQNGDLCSEKDRSRIMGRFNELLSEPPDPEHRKTYTFYRRILKNKGHIFVFLTDLSVPPDNNSSERAIRNVKVKQKVFGQFKAESAALDFAKIRSVIDTTIQNSQNVLEALRVIARNEFSLEA